jgi:hypothetical protein
MIEGIFRAIECEGGLADRESLCVFTPSSAVASMPYPLRLRREFSVQNRIAADNAFCADESHRECRQRSSIVELDRTDRGD